MSNQPPPAARGHVAVVDGLGYVESFKRMLIEDGLINIASELLHDAAAIQAMQRLGVYERFVTLCRAVMHFRANPETDAEIAARDAVRKLKFADRPEPFNEITPVRGPQTS